MRNKHLGPESNKVRKIGPRDTNIPSKGLGLAIADLDLRDWLPTMGHVDDPEICESP